MRGSTEVNGDAGEEQDIRGRGRSGLVDQPVVEKAGKKLSGGQ